MSKVKVVVTQEIVDEAAVRCVGGKSRSQNCPVFIAMERAGVPVYSVGFYYWYRSDPTTGSPGIRLPAELERVRERFDESAVYGDRIALNYPVECEVEFD